MKKTMIWLSLSLVVLFILPLLTVLYAGTNGMAICFLLFFTVNPLFFIIEGIFCGVSLKQHWWMPLASALLYLLSTWLLFDMGETVFLLYAGIYLGVGVFSMLGAYVGKKLWKEDHSL